MSDLQKLIDALENAAEEAAHDCATRRDFNDLFRARKAVADKVAELEQQLVAARKDAERWNWIASYLVSNDTSNDDAIVVARKFSELVKVIDAALQPKEPTC